MPVRDDLQAARARSGSASRAPASPASRRRCASARGAREKLSPPRSTARSTSTRAEGRPHVALPRALRGGGRGRRRRRRVSRRGSAEHVARRSSTAGARTLAEVQIAARYPYERRTPVTKLATQEMVSLDRDRRRLARGRAARRRGRGDRDQRLPVRAGSRPRRGRRAPAGCGVRRRRRRADPRARPARDAQPARPGTLLVGTTQRSTPSGSSRSSRAR